MVVRERMMLVVVMVLTVVDVDRDGGKVERMLIRMVVRW